MNEKEIQTLLASMTIEEKVAQMVQVPYTWVGKEKAELYALGCEHISGSIAYRILNYGELGREDRRCLNRVFLEAGSYPLKKWEGNRYLRNFTKIAESYRNNLYL